MTADRSLRAMMTLGLGLTMACASPQPKTMQRADRAPIVEALDGLCRQVREVAGQTSICPQDRKHALKDREDFRKIFASETGREIQKAIESAARGRQYAALVALAEHAGQPGWHCEELRRLVDEDPSFVSPKFDGQFLSDLDAYCRITEKNNREISDVLLRAHTTAKEARERAGCAMAYMLEGLANISWVDKYRVMKEMAADAGKPDWQCAALDPGTATPPRD
jgi:hypothetical protein